MNGKEVVSGACNIGAARTRDPYEAFHTRGQQGGQMRRRQASRQSSTFSRQQSATSFGAESTSSMDMVTQIVTGIMSEVMSYTKEMVVNKLMRLWGLLGERSSLQRTTDTEMVCAEVEFLTQSPGPTGCEGPGR